MGEKMSVLRQVIALVVIGIAFNSPALAQELSLADIQEKLQGEGWLTTVTGEPRTRTMTVTEVSQKAGGMEFAGTYNFSNSSSPSPIVDGRIAQASGRVTLTFVTNAGSAVSAEAQPDGTFSGTIKYKSGQTKAIKFEKGVAAAVETGQPLGGMLGKDETRALLAGKSMVIRRVRDNNELNWELKEGGELVGRNYTGKSGDVGRWHINDRGALCTTWQRSAAGCSLVRKDGDGYTMHASPSSPARYQVLSIK